MSAPPVRLILALLAVGLVGILVGLAAGLYLVRPLEIPLTPQKPTAEAPVAYIPTPFAALPGWSSDQTAQALPALLASCRTFANREATDTIGTGPISRSAAAWQQACANLAGVSDDATARARLEQFFTPYAVTGPGKTGSQSPEGLFTGYYEADLKGSLTRDGAFQFPIYGVPRDIVSVDLAQFIPDLPPLLPKQLVGRVDTGKAGNAILSPYFTRQQIDEEHVLDDKADVLLWSDDPVAVHILHIQGSGRVTLPDGREIHVGFAGHNGRSFRGIGSILIAAGVLKSGEANMDRVRAWLRTHPAEAARYMNENARYIFFRVNPSEENQGPIGALGLPLTAGRSLAVDPRFVPLGVPLWLDTTSPDNAPIRRLVAAQDTGAAITGAVRGDLFWGHGESAFAMAARMRSPGRYFVLIPAQ